MTRTLYGKEVAVRFDAATTEDVNLLKEDGIFPCLAVIRVGDDPDDVAYERQVIRKAEQVGVMVQKMELNESATQEELIALIHRINQDGSIHGVLLLRPLPPQMDENKICNLLAPEKDIDGMTDLSLAGVFCGRQVGFPPCTAQACMEILHDVPVDLTGKKAVVLGRSQVVGKPVAMMLLQENATVTICHSATRDLPREISQADIVIAAVGQPGAVGRHNGLSGHQVVIDVGINMIDGKLVGDVAATADGAVAALTPVPGGVGTVTVSVLMQHVVQAAMRE